MLSFPTISKARWRLLRSLGVAGLIALSCKQTADPYAELVEGQISYPFTERTERIGKDPAQDRFVIRSVKGESEYIVEIPDGGDDYDIAVPMQGLPGGGGGGASKKDPKNPQLTDRELLSAMPRPDQEQERDRAMLEDALGVGAGEAREQGPSYSLGLAKVVEYFKSRQYEYALIEVNQLISFYPNAARLYKMKGTILLKTRELELAEKAWARASELDPKDRGIVRGIERIRRRLDLQRRDPLDVPSKAKTAPEAAGGQNKVREETAAPPPPSAP